MSVESTFPSGCVQLTSMPGQPLIAYRQLLATVVTSTRTHFSDFKRSHQKDQRYRDFGKTEGDREKEFKRYLRELGERKREAAEKAEKEFAEMLKEDEEIRAGDKWADVCRRDGYPYLTSMTNASHRAGQEATCQRLALHRRQLFVPARAVF